MLNYIVHNLTIKAPNKKTAADDILIFYFYLSKKNEAWFFMWILCLEESLETSSLIFSEKQWKNIYECHLLQFDWHFKG